MRARQTGAAPQAIAPTVVSSPSDLYAALRTVAARSRVVLGVDFDGTLAPLVTDPMQARAAPGAIEALRAAAALPGVTVALVSGRDLATLRLLAGISEDEPIVLIGSHGGQSSHADADQAELLSPDAGALLAVVTTALEQVIARHPPVRIEHKPAAVALHTRGVDPTIGAEALAEARELADRHTGVHLMEGKDVAELSVLETSKGAALRALASRCGADATVYLGDDVTDERAFAALDDAAGDLTVKVGAGPTVAAHRVSDVAGVVQVLEAFVTMRPPQGT